MGIFVCDNCNTMENTAMGHYWSKDVCQLMGFPLGVALCSACIPEFYANGEKVEKREAPLGQWHGKWPRVEWDGKREVMNRETDEQKYKREFKDERWQKHLARMDKHKQIKERKERLRNESKLSSGS